MLLALLFVALLAGCAAPDNPADESPVNQPETAGQETPTGQNAGVETEVEQDATSTSGPDCYGPEIHPVGQSIADNFEDETSYEQVMVWFCNGHYFDDILTALQTETLTSISAEDLLEMLSGGQTWDQIWVEIGLTEE
jgi:hypothetical protein